MPKIIIHAPEAAFDADSRQAIARDLTELALECEALPKSPFVKSTVWTYFNDYAVGKVFMGASRATMNVVSMQIFVIEGGLHADAKTKLIKGATAILGRHLSVTERSRLHRHSRGAGDQLGDFRRARRPRGAAGVLGHEDALQHREAV